VDASDPARPALVFKSWVRDCTRLTPWTDPATGETMMAIYPSQGENFYVYCPAGGAGPCTTKFGDLYHTADFVHFHQSWIVSTAAGADYLTLNFHDVTYTETPAPVAFFSGKNNYIFVSLQDGTLAVYDIDQANTSERGDGKLPLVKTIASQGRNPIFNCIFENRLAVLDSSGLIEIFDITDPLNPALADSVTVPGARRLDHDGTRTHVVSDREYRVAGQQSTGDDSRVLGITEGATVSGVINIRPNPAVLPGIRKVSYYLNGTKCGKVYASPFLWGGPSGNGTAGFNTAGIANGDYTLSMVYTDATGDHEIPIHFTAAN
jgi:hypothetical protein